MDPNWEGSYKITSATNIGAYYLEEFDENVISRPRNVNKLRHYELLCYLCLIFLCFSMDAFVEIIIMYGKVLSVK